MGKLLNRVSATIGLVAFAVALVLLNAYAEQSQRGGSSDSREGHAPWAPLTEGPGAGGMLLEFGRKGRPAPGGGYFLRDANGLPDVIVANRRGEIAFHAAVDADGNGTADFEALFFGRPGALVRILRTGDLLPDGSTVQNLPITPERLLLTDDGTLYFAAGIPKYVSSWPFGGAAHVGLFGWNEGRLFTLVGRGMSRTADGKYIHNLDRLRLVSPHQIAFDALLLDADGISRGDRSFFVYATP